MLRYSRMFSILRLLSTWSVMLKPSSEPLMMATNLQAVQDR